jgi:hypothetical protein
VKFENPRFSNAVKIMGPYPYVTLSYESLRVGPHGDPIAIYEVDDDFWRVDGDSERYTDVTIYMEEERDGLGATAGGTGGTTKMPADSI